RRRHGEVTRRGHLTFSLRSEDPEFRAIREERHCQIRRMHDVTRPVVSENRMKLILAGRREAAIAALLEADEFFIAEIPAARTLIDVAADGSGVPDLRRPDLSGSAGERRVQARDLLMLQKINYLHRRADLHASIGSTHSRRFKSILDVDDAVG